ncbi:NACHT, LRR and PYD domains-containing protein 3-like isoform X3 [Eucyclogobius newberryi]|uniref:NACHT, LRR and PYD domains-containing protein 3-like isoform X3 n=1 Tax=Eucyclogobius newberryi TaxID=166745 RepID=UPI003B59F8D1
MEKPPEFRLQPPSNTLETSPDSRCLSVKSDRSQMNPPDFSIEPGPSETLEEKRHEEDSKVVNEICCLHEHKQILKGKYESVTEGLDRAAPQAPLNRIYTELYITEGQRPEAEVQHELNWLETVIGKDSVSDSTVIRCSDIFKAFTEEQRLRAVLTSGVAGVGKTFSVLKFCLDWAEDSENQDLELVLPLTFRELNLARRGRYSLLELLHMFHSSLRHLSAHTLLHAKVLFIFDGLDELRLPLDFSCEVVSEVTQSSEVNILLVNLIRGNLLPEALIWITSRPAAANQIPAQCVHRVTEVRGFVTDAQKEQYFTKRFSNMQQCNTALSHIRTSHSLYTMCQIPVFCWIIATVLEDMLKTEQHEPLPQTLTDLYAHFLIGQSWKKRLKYPQTSVELAEPSGELPVADRKLLLRLGRLAFEQLDQGNLLFYEEDLEQVGLNVTDAVVRAGVCSEIFKRDCVIFDQPIYCFIHLSIQEFLAAVYLIHNYIKSKVLKWILEREGQSSPISNFLTKVMKKSLKSKTGHLDLVVRFLHGLCLESNLKVLQGLLGPLEMDVETTEKVIDNLKEMNVAEVSADRSINLIHCLMEMRYHNLQEEIQVLLKAKRESATRLSDIQCSALAYMLQSSEEVFDEFDMRSYSVSQQGKERLVPAVRRCRKAVLDYPPSDVNCEIVASALNCDPSHLQELELVCLKDSGLNILSSGLQSPNCRLEVLRLRFNQSEVHLAPLVSALKSNPAHLRELGLMYIHTLDSGMEQLCEFLQSPDCCLETLRFISHTKISCSLLASALKSNPVRVKELDLSKNALLDSDVELLCGFLKSPDGQLQTLRLEDCSLSESCCSSLASALNPSRLRQLDLSGNSDIKDSGVEQLCGFLKRPNCRLETLRVKSCSLSESSCSSLASALKSNPSHLRELDLSENNDINDSGVEHLCGFLQSPNCRLEKLRLNSSKISRSSFNSIKTILKSESSSLKELSLTVDGSQLSDEKDLDRIGKCHLQITFKPYVYDMDDEYDDSDYNRDDSDDDYNDDHDDYNDDDDDRDDDDDNHDDCNDDHDDYNDDHDDYNDDHDDYNDDHDDYNDDHDDYNDDHDDYNDDDDDDDCDGYDWT